VTRIRWTRTALAALLAAALLLAGCGSDNKSSGGGGGGGGGGTDNPVVTPKVDEAVKQCLDQAKQVQQADARKTAEEACKAAKSGNTEKVKSAAKQECLNAVKQIPDSAKEQKDAAIKRCDAIK
jgi:hypothetical protein